MKRKPHPQSRRRRLGFENLEVRRVLAAFNMPWPEPDHISISFLPDGTQVGNRASNLFETLDAVLPTEAWQETILRAFQTWAGHSNLNFSLALDTGLPVGSLGFKQGDPRFGDVRIGAFPMASDTLAVANPYDAFVVNTWVGDIFLNGAWPGLDSQSDAAEALYHIMLHEAGHILGLGHSQDSASPMFAQLLTNSSASPAAADIAALQSQYGARRPDALEGPAANDSLATAAVIALPAQGDQLYPAAVAADLTNVDDVDVYRVVVPAGVSVIDVKLLAAEASLVATKLSVLDDGGNVVAQASATDPTHNDLELAVAQFRPGDVYFLRVEAARRDAFGVGAYHLSLAARGSAGLIQPPAPDLTGGLEPVLLATTPGYVEHTYYEAHVTLDAFAPRIRYRVRSVDLGPDLNNVFTVVIDGYGNRAPLDIRISDDQGRPVAGEFLVNEPNRWQIMVQNVRSAADYVIEVSGDVSQGPIEVEVEVDFAQDGTHQETFVSDGLAADEDQVVSTWIVNRSQLFHLTLAASDYSQPVETGVRMTIENSRGEVLLQSEVSDGAVRTVDMFLDPGVYTVRFTRAGASREPLFFQLSGAVQTSPIGPLLRDTTLDPVTTPVDAALAQLSFYWLPGRTSDALTTSSAAREVRTAALFSAATAALNARDLAAVAASGDGSFGVPSKATATARSSSLTPSSVSPSLPGLDRLTATSQGEKDANHDEDDGRLPTKKGVVPRRLDVKGNEPSRSKPAKRPATTVAVPAAPGQDTTGPTGAAAPGDSGGDRTNPTGEPSSSPDNQSQVQPPSEPISASGWQKLAGWGTFALAFVTPLWNKPTASAALKGTKPGAPQPAGAVSRRSRLRVQRLR